MLFLLLFLPFSSLTNLVYLTLYLMKRRKYTARAKVLRSIRLAKTQLNVWAAAAAKEEISQSEFLRRALTERAQRILLSENNPSQLEHLR
jgi:hypothetical protein